MLGWSHLSGRWRQAARFLTGCGDSITKDQNSCGVRLRILFIGDIFGRPGRNSVREHMPALMRQHAVDLCIANGENAAGGFGLTPQIAEDFFDLGIDVITTGNHVWDKRELTDYFNAAIDEPFSPARRVLRPANYPAGTPGTGVYEGSTRSGTAYAVINLQGRVFMPSIDDPFRVADRLLSQIAAKIIFVDFHAEATSEKVALGWYLDGRVTAVIGTHTHIPTADTRVLPGGTAYQTDVGMTGPYDSVIGVQKEQILQRFLTSLPARFEAAVNDVRFCAVLIDCDEQTGHARSIERIILDENGCAQSSQALASQAGDSGARSKECQNKK
jgi:2',3'-cyclic-nucleotide 2'-phosphodiesterase